jgi:hypothetical protein
MSVAPTNPTPRRARLSSRGLLLGRFSLDTWAVVAASALVLAIVVGTLPRIPW